MAINRDEQSLGEMIREFRTLMAEQKTLAADVRKDYERTKDELWREVNKQASDVGLLKYQTGEMKADIKETQAECKEEIGLIKKSREENERTRLQTRTQVFVAIIAAGAALIVGVLNFFK